jgi:hypothetical protein
MTAFGFVLEEDAIALPKGAWARTHRRTLRRSGTPVLSLTQGRQRCYAFPVFTPAGYAVTSESPADHPHHNSFWIASDHVHGRMPVESDKYEEYTYNFYVDETFQGRAPGRLIAVSSEAQPLGGDRVRIAQEIEWRGPIEWAAPDGRLVAREVRSLTLAAERDMYVIDVESQLAPANWDFSLGPTRHAYFNVRVAESIVIANGGRVRDDRGRSGGEAVTGSEARWVDFSGPVGGSHVAGLSVFPDPRDHDNLSWFVADWGVVTVGPFRINGLVVRQGESFTARYRVLVHDGDADTADVAGHYAAYIASLLP